MVRTYIGADNGLDGGLVALDSDGAIVGRIVMPTIVCKKGREVDAGEVANFVTSFHAPTVLIESASKHSPGKLALCSTWFSFGITKTAVALSGVPLSIVQPQAWQKAFWTRPRLPRGEKFDTKAAALKAANEIWPGQDWTKSTRATKPHDGMVDAALIAEHHRRNHE